MSHINYEFKASATDINELENKFKGLNPEFRGTDHQTDTYFNVPEGRMKLREGNIENSLIFYERENLKDAKVSRILLYRHNPDPVLKEILTKVNGIKAVVKKERKIYFIDNVKFHFDNVEGLGSFIEVEAIDANGDLGIEKIREQCLFYANFFGIRESDYISHSYSDLIVGISRQCKNNSLSD
ncbi:MAG: class IV adenylate cyclase [Ignavibacteriaceae bacterium]|nr:class IV adenylate cyclase [Ignavibacteriaceae bacterium]